MNHLCDPLESMFRMMIRKHIKSIAHIDYQYPPPPPSQIPNPCPASPPTVTNVRIGLCRTSCRPHVSTVPCDHGVSECRLRPSCSLCFTYQNDDPHTPADLPKDIQIYDIFGVASAKNDTKNTKPLDHNIHQYQQQHSEAL
jgi:hypothetical protein